MNNPLLTIFIPTYRRPRFLTKAIKSVLSQTWHNLQVVICDNASQDETAEIVSQFKQADPRVHYIGHSTNLGMLGNYQFIFSHVETEFFTILSDDDILLPSFCETALKGFSDFPDIFFFAGSAIIAGTAQGVIGAPLDGWSREGLFHPPEGLIEMIGKYPVPMCILFRKQVVSHAQIDLDNPIIWDCDFLAQLAGKFPFAISKKYCGLFRVHAESLTGSSGYAPLLEGFKKFKVRVRNYSFIENSVKAVIDSRLKEDIYKMRISSIKLSLKNKKSPEARREARELRKEYRWKKELIVLLVVAEVCFYFPFAHFFLSLIRSLKKMNRKEPWQGFEQYRKLLDGCNEPA